MYVSPSYWVWLINCSWSNQLNIGKYWQILAFAVHHFSFTDSHTQFKYSYVTHHHHCRHHLRLTHAKCKLSKAKRNISWIPIVCMNCWLWWLRWRQRLTFDNNNNIIIENNSFVMRCSTSISFNVSLTLTSPFTYTLHICEDPEIE